MNIRLHIERLVLEGVPIEQRQGPQLQAALEQELSILLADGGSLARLSRGGAMASIDGGAIHMAPGADAESLGRQIATAVHGRLGDR